jgi:hypothetical protein
LCPYRAPRQHFHRGTKGSLSLTEVNIGEHLCAVPLETSEHD